MKSSFFQIIVLAGIILLFEVQVHAQGYTSAYVFTDESQVTQTGGLAGVDETYLIRGQFQLTVDIDAGVASIAAVDANLLNPTGFLPTTSLGELFNMTVLESTTVNSTLIEFKGKTADNTDTDVELKLEFTNRAIRLTGQTMPPSHSADFFVFDLDAVAQLKYSGGTGEPNDPYHLSSASDLALLGRTPDDYDKHFRLIADIDLGYHPEAEFNMIGTIDAPFTGVFDGDGHKICGFTYHSYGKASVGLFRTVGEQGRISNLGVEDVDIDVRAGNFVAGLVGRNKGTLTGCYVTGSVTGSYQVGGLAGINEHDHGEISNCYSTASVQGTDFVGGLAGKNWGYIYHCYSTGTVSGAGDDRGGLAGFNHWDPFGLSSGSVLNSFWDIETSNQSTSAGEATGLSSIDMQVANNFLESGWDFIDETDNGTDDIWKMWDGYDTPHLAWEPGPDTPLVFVDINDSGAGMINDIGIPIDMGGFNGQMSKYETTNAQYCQYLNAALADRAIRLYNHRVYSVTDTSRSEVYFDTYPSDPESQITYSSGAFHVRSRDGYSMDNHPVLEVSWYGATAFAAYYGYRLPTEWEWQAVADFDGSYLYPCGGSINQDKANYNNGRWANPLGLSKLPYTSPVGYYPAYGYGLCDMAGNVWEWTDTPSGSFYVMRSGSYYNHAHSSLVYHRQHEGPPIATHLNIGFRVCR